MIEYEKKLMLTQKGYDCLRGFLCKSAKSYFQTNYYFDTDDFSMNRQGITYRVREKNGLFKATVKNHGTQKKYCSTEKDLIVKNRLDFNVFKPFKIKFQGILITERTVIFKDSSCEIVLDKNIYLGTVDYELEIEYKEGCENLADGLMNDLTAMLNLFKKFDSQEVYYMGQCKSKSERFFEKLKIN